MLTEAGNVTITSATPSYSLSCPNLTLQPNSSGTNSAITQEVAAGVNTISVPMGIGSQIFTLSRGGATVLNGTGGLDTTTSCSVYNFNAYAGALTSS